MWFPSKYKVCKRSLLLPLLIPVGHHALQIESINFVACWLGNSSVLVTDGWLLFFLREGKQPKHIKTRNGQFDSLLIFTSSKGHPPCLGIARTCGPLACVSSHPDVVLLGRCGSISYFFLKQKHFLNRIFLYLSWLPLCCTGFSQTGILDMKFPYVC